VDGSLELWRRACAEGVAAFALVFAGCGAVIVDQRTQHALGPVGISLVFGLVVMALVYATGHLSGAHFNPAVTIAFTLTRHFSARDALAYIVAQLTGATLAALLLAGVWTNEPAHLGATLPTVAAGSALLYEVVLTALLMFVVIAVATDTRAVGTGAAIAIGGTIGLAALAGGPVSGASLNPARSFGPAHRRRMARSVGIPRRPGPRSGHRRVRLRASARAASAQSARCRIGGSPRARAAPHRAGANSPRQPERQFQDPDPRSPPMNSDRMVELAQALAVAKSRQDVPAAMMLLHPEMVLETPAFGTRYQGTAENERALSRFFGTFPDYHVLLEGHAANEETLICWGTVKMTLTGERFGVVPNGKRAELPVFIQFGFKDDLITSERFSFDLSALCAQSGVSTDAVRRVLFGADEHVDTHRNDDQRPAVVGSA
jgi:aquaporin NIP